MFEVRKDEPDYAFIPDKPAPEVNRYGNPVQLVEEGDPLAGKSLCINGDDTVVESPNRYKQHGFYFNADNCISCHACESACSEKNDLPAHLAFRSVGYVEGGSWPDYRRLNISMACNHCDNPVCLKGCPTRAYTKFAEYGAVLQDPDICFGCGYCTWVCPYNAPQLDPVKGQVEKCNMCVDRLEVGLKPACAAACLAGALDFGIIETTPDNRHQLETKIPGFPDPDISQPNIRFQQTRSLPREMQRTDDMPLRYERDEQRGNAFRSKLRESRSERQWGLTKLRSREDPLVIFTLITQAVVGGFATLFLGERSGLPGFGFSGQPLLYSMLLFGMLGLQTFALVLSTLHLGKPQRFYRAFNNLRYSPVSREVAGIAVFFNLLGAYTLITVVSTWTDWLPVSLTGPILQLTGWGAVTSGLAALWFMHAIYRIKARPFWNHWQVLTSFYGSMLALGPLLVGLVFADSLGRDGLRVLAWPVATGLALELAGLYFHRRALIRGGGEAAASHHVQVTRFGKTYLARNTGLVIALAAAVAAGLWGPVGPAGLVAGAALVTLIVVTALLGRALFYVLVIPTTMPGAFFWRNRGFQDHARRTGLAHMPQTGVIPDAH